LTYATKAYKRVDMNLLPKTIPAATASLIAGLSPSTFRRTVLPVLETEGGKVVLASLEAHLGRSVTPADYLAADRARDRARAYQTAYRTRAA
jgi:hypothetical protein